MEGANVLGIVGCVVLADELSYVLSRDKGISQVFIVENEAGTILKDKLLRKRMEVEMLTPHELDRVARQDRYCVLIWMNMAGPHDDQNELREIVKNATAALSDHVGLCLCFYGLCRNSLWRIDHLGTEVGVPMMLLTDVDGMEVDDCFGANIGGKKEYLDAIKENHRTVFVSPGYAENWHRRQSKKDLARVIEQVKNMRFVFEHMGYSQVMRLENGLGDRDKFLDRVDGFAKIFDFKVLARPCGLRVFENSYSLAKARLSELRPKSLAPMLVKAISLLNRPGQLAVSKSHQKD